MAINFDSIISNAKGTANIAKLKVTLGFKTNELNKLYTELGKLFYDFTKNNQTEEVESVSEDNHSSENEITNSSVTDYMADENIRACYEKIPSLEQEIAILESQISNEKDNMKPMSTPTETGYSQTNYSQDPVTPTGSGAKCPKCGKVQSEDDEFCVNCGTKISKYQEE